MDTFILPKQFTAWGHPATLDPRDGAGRYGNTFSRYFGAKRPF
jgi:hypothetical protein